jgi:ParB family chromosome partitioning protein
MVQQPPKTQLPRKTGLGKGINSLLGGLDSQNRSPSDYRVDTPTATTASESSASASVEDERQFVISLPIESIVVNPHQPRKIFQESELKALADSLKQDGVLQPITVVPGERSGTYMLIAGERRLRASKLAGFDAIPAIVRPSMSDQDKLRIALIENIQRQDLNALEEAEAYKRLIEEFGLTQEQCADRVGKERSTVTNTLRILQLPREIQEDLAQNRLTMGHSRALLSLEDRKLQLRARDIIIKKGLNVRQTEQLCKTYKQNPKGALSGATSKDSGDLNYIADSLRSLLKTKIKISGTPAKGKIEVSYFSAVELERLLSIMGHQFS